MFARGLEARLIELAIRLTQIAVRSAIRYLLFAPSRGRTAKPSVERSREGFRGTEADRQGHVENRHARLRGESHGGDFHASAAHIVAECFTHPCREHAMEMIGREVRDAG